MSELSWFGMVLVGLWAIAPIVVIARLGAPRDPYDKGDAILQLLLAAALIVLLLTVGTGR